MNRKEMHRILRDDNLLAISNTRKVYKFGGEIYKEAINLCGLESNKIECNISIKEDIAIKTVTVTKNFMIVKATEFIEIHDSDKTFLSHFELSRKDLLLTMEYHYFKNEESKKRLGPLEVRTLTYNKKYDTALLNANVKELVDFSVRNRLEPGDMVRGISIVNGKTKVFDFGLTERNYFDNMFMVIILEEDPESKPIISFSYFKGFDRRFRNTLPRNRARGNSIPLQNLSLTDDFFVRKYKELKPKNNRLIYNHKQGIFYN